MDTVVTAIRTLFAVATQRTPLFKVHGGSSTENLALQNIQVSEMRHTHKHTNTLSSLFVDWGVCLEGSIADVVELYVCSTLALGERSRWRAFSLGECQR